MARRSKKRRPKRTSVRTKRQERLLLEKEVRERYRPGAADELDVEEWLVEDPDRRERSGPSSGEAEMEREIAREGRLVGLYSGGGTVETDDGETVPVVLSSRIASEQRSSLAIGDRVGLAETPEGPLRVVAIRPRRTFLARSDPQHPEREHLIAANVDVAVVVASVVRPSLRPVLVDRYLVLVQRGGLDAIVWLNKTDLADEGELEEAVTALHHVESRGVELLRGSAKEPESLTPLRGLLEGRTAVFVGHSGVGKSSLIQALDPDLHLRIRAVDDEGRGRHTTTRSSLHHLAGGVDVIDTPGIRELGLGKLELPELREAFPDLAELSTRCRFQDCTHTHEPGCAVAAAVEAGEIREERLRAWTRLLESE